MIDRESRQDFDERENVRRSSRLISKWLALACLLFSGIGAFGWMLGIPLLIQGFPGFPDIQPNTIIGLILGAIATLLLLAERKTKFRIFTVRLFAFFVLLLGLITLSEYIFSWQSSFDFLLIPSSYVSPHGYPGRPSPQAAFNFVLLGLALLTSSYSFLSVFIRQSILLLIAANAVLSATGYLFSNTQYLGFPVYDPTYGMAIHTSLSFIFLAASLMCLQCDQGLMRIATNTTRTGKMVRKILISSLVLPPFIGALTRLGVALGIYDVTTQAAIFIVIMVSVILRATWKAAQQAEQDELLAKSFSNQQAFLSETTRILESTLDLEERLQLMADATIPVIADICVIGILKNNHLEFGAASIRDRSKLEKLKQISPLALAAEGPTRAITVTRTGQPMLVENVSEMADQRQGPHFTQKVDMEKFGVKSFLILPLINKGKPIGSISLSMTTPGRRFSEEDIVFAQIVANRFALAIENAQLYKEAKQAITARENILRIVSHDLRNPLSTISMIAEVLEETSSQDEKTQFYVRKLQSGSQQMTRLLSDLLEYERLESGTLTIQPQRILLREIVESALDALIEKARSKNIQLIVNVRSKNSSVIWDKDRIIQVLWNLIGNAIKFTPENGRVTIEASDVNGSVKISVSDTGPGIAEENFDKVFEQFWQAKETASLGTGLGLSIAKRIIEAHGGSIQVESKIGRGSCFYFIVPVDINRLEPSASQAISSQAVSVPRHDVSVGFSL